MQKDSTTGDKCHYDIIGLKDSQAKRIFTDNFELLQDGEICDADCPRQIISIDIKLLESHGLYH